MSVSYLLAGAGAAYVVSVLLQVLAASVGFFARLYDSDLVRHGIPIATAALVFGYLMFNTKTRAWGQEVIVEISKIVWPSRKDTQRMTVAVSIIILLAGAILGFFDFISRHLVNIIIDI